MTRTTLIFQSRYKGLVRPDHSKDSPLNHSHLALGSSQMTAAEAVAELLRARTSPSEALPGLFGAIKTFCALFSSPHHLISSPGDNGESGAAPPAEIERLGALLAGKLTAATVRECFQALSERKRNGKGGNDSSYWELSLSLVRAVVSALRTVLAGRVQGEKNLDLLFFSPGNEMKSGLGRGERDSKEQIALEALSRGIIGALEAGSGMHGRFRAFGEDAGNAQPGGDLAVSPAPLVEIVRGLLECAVGRPWTTSAPLSVSHPRIIAVILDIAPALGEACGSPHSDAEESSVVFVTLHSLVGLMHASTPNCEALQRVDGIRLLCAAQWLYAASRWAAVVPYASLLRSLVSNRLHPSELQPILTSIAEHSRDPMTEAAAAGALQALRKAAESHIRLLVEPKNSWPTGFLDFVDPRSRVSSSIRPLPVTSFACAIRFRVESWSTWPQPEASPVSLCCFHQRRTGRDRGPRMTLSFVPSTGSTDRRQLAVTVLHSTTDPTSRHPSPPQRLQRSSHTFQFEFRTRQWYVLMLGQRRPSAHSFVKLFTGDDSRLKLFVNGADRTGEPCSTPYPADLCGGAGNGQESLPMCLGYCQDARLPSFRGQISSIVVFDSPLLDKPAATNICSLMLKEGACFEGSDYSRTSAIDARYSCGRNKFENVRELHEDLVDLANPTAVARLSPLVQLRTFWGVPFAIQALCGIEGLLSFCELADHKMDWSPFRTSASRECASPVVFHEFIQLVRALVGHVSIDFEALSFVLGSLGVGGQSSQALVHLSDVPALAFGVYGEWETIAPLVLDWRWFARANLSTQGVIVKNLGGVVKTVAERFADHVLHMFRSLLANVARFTGDDRERVATSRADWRDRSKDIRHSVWRTLEFLLFHPSLKKSQRRVLVEELRDGLLLGWDEPACLEVLAMFDRWASECPQKADGNVAGDDTDRKSGRFASLSGLLGGPKASESHGVSPPLAVFDAILTLGRHGRRMSFYEFISVFLRHRSAKLRHAAILLFSSFASAHVDLAKRGLVREQVDERTLRRCLLPHLRGEQAFPEGAEDIAWTRALTHLCFGPKARNVNPLVSAILFEMVAALLVSSGRHLPRFAKDILSVLDTLVRHHGAHQQPTSSCFCLHLDPHVVARLWTSFLQVEPRKPTAASQKPLEIPTEEVNWAQRQWGIYVRQKAAEEEAQVALQGVNPILMSFCASVLSHMVAHTPGRVRTFFSSSCLDPRPGVELNRLQIRSKLSEELFHGSCASFLEVLAVVDRYEEGYRTTQDKEVVFNLRSAAVAFGFRAAETIHAGAGLARGDDRSWNFLLDSFLVLQACEHLVAGWNASLTESRLTLLTEALRGESECKTPPPERLLEMYDETGETCLIHPSCTTLTPAVSGAIGAILKMLDGFTHDGSVPNSFRRRILSVWAISILTATFTHFKADLFADDDCALDEISLAELRSMKTVFEELAAAGLDDPPSVDFDDFLRIVSDLIPYFEKKSAVSPAFPGREEPEHLESLDTPRYRHSVAVSRPSNDSELWLRVTANHQQRIRANVGAWFHSDVESKSSCLWRLDSHENRHRMRLRMRNTRHDAAGREEPDAVALLSQVAKYVAGEKSEMGAVNIEDPLSAEITADGIPVQLVTPWHSHVGLLKIDSEERVLRFHTTARSRTKYAAAHESGLVANTVKVWPLKTIREIHSRSYTLRDTALEFFCTDHAIFFLNFGSPAVKEEAFQRILKLKKKGACPALVFAERLNVDKSQLLKRENLVRLWQRREMSNFDYLMALNTISGRTFNDLGQYPVFPWVLVDYSSDELDFSDPAIYRDLSKPIGALNERRKELAQEKFANWVDAGAADDDPDRIRPFHWGSHYSSEALVLYYLVRIEPFAYLHTKLQSGRFDRPDRLFRSLETTWQSCMRDEASVQELIPEFFYFPEFLKCSSHLFLPDGKETVLGRTQDGGIVSDVALPPWAHGSPDEFIQKHRLALESDYVSAHLHEWVDLIFGFKSRGRNAEESVNCFYYLTYAEQVPDVEKMTPQARQAIVDQIRNFGQTPTRLFRDPHPERLPRVPDPERATSGPTATKSSELFSADGLQITKEVHGQFPALASVHTPRLTNAKLAQFHHQGTNTVVTVDSQHVISSHRWMV
jgi:Beige/BEACH domain/PH domain associated with Beige/BEACH